MFQAVKDFFKTKDQVDQAAYDWHRQCLLTPDVWKLEQSMYQLVFVPDDLMQGHRHNNLIAEYGYSGDTPLHPGCFTLERFTYFKKDLGIESFGIPMEKKFKPLGYIGSYNPSPSKIRGELYAILSPAIKTLDIHRQNGLQFRRIRTMIHLPYREVRFSKEQPIPNITPEFLRTVEAWMYVGVPEYWEDRISNLFGINEVKKFELDQPKYWLEDYYKFV